MRIEPLRLKFPVRLDAEFKYEAKKKFPKETLAYVLGSITKGQIIACEELFWPDNSIGSENDIIVKDHWLREAQDSAKEQGLEVIGSIHSHPWKYKEGNMNWPPDRAPSENDYDSVLIHAGMLGICVVQEMANHKLRASIRFWSPMLNVKTVHEKDN
jgi:hypothetical protein